MAPSPVILADPPIPPEPIGLIAAGGRLPVLVAEGMRQAGHPVYAIGLSGQYEPSICDLCDRFGEVGAMRLGSWGKRLSRMGVRHAVMVGKVDKAKLMHSWRTIIRNRPDTTSLGLWVKLRRDRRSHIILNAIAERLAADGVQLIDSTTHISDHLAEVGCMTRREPTLGQRADIDLGWPILLQLLGLDVGQAIAVRERDVIAVEAVEGTDRMIERCDELMPAPGWTLLKGARAGHDRRSDVPVIGPDTIHTMHRCGGRCVAVAAGDVIILDKPETLRIADELGIAVVGMPQA
ncbi:MAG: UDP-2,3-diacylglucosamine diphosphatase LpxI [Planctomycetota bacterium]